MAYQQLIPEIWTSQSIDELTAKIQQFKRELGNRLFLLTHHYQRAEVVELGDCRGDSLRLAQAAAAQVHAEFIVYCGVHFMAESADILKAEHQTVFLPDLEAGCDMADMAPALQVKQAWEQLTSRLGHEDILPVTYVNSSAALKAFVGEKGGVVCTSSNADKIVKWALEQKKMIFFFPDQHLGRYTCRKLGIPASQMLLWQRDREDGGVTAAELQTAKVFLWDGSCPVHQIFRPEQVDRILARDLEFRIIVHPECDLSIIDMAEFVGSTEFIVRTIAESPAGSKWAVGTELNLVMRLAKEHPDKKIIPINQFGCLCSTMNRIDLPHLAWVLSEIIEGRRPNVVRVAEPIRSLAKSALDRMLELSR